MRIEKLDMELFVVTYMQILAANGSGQIHIFELGGYFLDKYPIKSDLGKPLVTMVCEVHYDERSGTLQNVFIKDFTVNEYRQNQGYGSIVMNQLIEYAKYLKASYVSGRLSFVDIGTSDNDEIKRENRERLYHFYSKFGFEIDKKNNTIRLDLRK